MFGFKLVRKSKWKEEQQLLRSFKETVFALDKECGEFTKFLSNDIQLNASGETCLALTRHVSIIDALITIYAKNPLTQPLYDINFLKKNEIIRNYANKLKSMLITIHGVIETTEVAFNKIKTNENIDEETCQDMEDKLNESFNDFMGCAKKDLDEIVTILLKTTYTIHAGVTHDILRCLMGVDILMEYHNKTSISDTILQTFRIDVIKSDKYKKGIGDTNESSIK